MILHDIIHVSDQKKNVYHTGRCLTCRRPCRCSPWEVPVPTVPQQTRSRSLPRGRQSSLCPTNGALPSKIERKRDRERDRKQSKIQDNKNEIRKDILHEKEKEIYKKRDEKRDKKSREYAKKTYLVHKTKRKGKQWKGVVLSL